MKLSTCDSSSGFTLVEMLVALAIFMVVAVVAVGALLKITDANRKSETLEDAVNNVNYAMDAITRELRSGSLYDCYDSGSGSFSGTASASLSCLGVTDQTQGTSIAFLSSNQDPSATTHDLTYAYDFVQHPDGVAGHWTIVKAQQNHYTDSLSAYQSSSTPGSYFPIMDPSIVITNYRVSVKASDEYPNDEPEIFLYVSGYTGATSNQQTYFDVQTTISERI